MEHRDVLIAERSPKPKPPIPLRSFKRKKNDDSLNNFRITHDQPVKISWCDFKS